MIRLMLTTQIFENKKIKLDRIGYMDAFVFEISEQIHGEKFNSPRIQDSMCKQVTDGSGKNYFRDKTDEFFNNNYNEIKSNKSVGKGILRKGTQNSFYGIKKTVRFSDHYEIIGSSEMEINLNENLDLKNYDSETVQMSAKDQFILNYLRNLENPSEEEFIRQQNRYAVEIDYQKKYPCADNINTHGKTLFYRGMPPRLYYEYNSSQNAKTYGVLSKTELFEHAQTVSSSFNVLVYERKNPGAQNLLSARAQTVDEITKKWNYSTPYNYFYFNYLNIKKEMNHTVPTNNYLCPIKFVNYDEKKIQLNQLKEDLKSSNNAFWFQRTRDATCTIL